MQQSLGDSHFILTDEHSGRATGSSDVIVGREQLAVGIRRENGAHTMLIPVDTLPSVIAFLSSSDSGELSTDAVRVISSDVSHMSHCVACTTDDVPSGNSYVLQQFWGRAGPSGMITLTVHKACIDRFIEVLERTWLHADKALGQQL